MVTVELTGAGLHPPNTVVPAASAAPVTHPKRDVVTVIVLLRELQRNYRYRTVVVSVVRRVVVESPYGLTAVSLVVVLVWSVTTPLLSIVR